MCVGARCACAVQVGWIFSQSTKERDYIMSSEELCQVGGRTALGAAGRRGDACAGHAACRAVSAGQQRMHMCALIRALPRCPQMAAIQDEMGEHAVTAVVVTYPGEDEQPEVHFEVRAGGPGVRCALTMTARSHSVKGVLLTAGESWLHHLTRVCSSSLALVCC